MMKIRSFIFVLVLLFGGIVYTKYVSADDTQVMGGYSIEGIPNSHQIDNKVGYFYLNEKPSEKDQIRIKLTNDSSSEKSLSVKVTDANTNINGEVDYTGNIKNHHVLTQPLTSIVHANQSVIKVPAKTSVETFLKVEMPKERFEGNILGGVMVSDITHKNEEMKTVTNTYSYTLGIVLTNTNKAQLSRNISLQLDSVGAKLFNGKKVVEADILNPNPYIFSSKCITGVIQDKKSRKVIQKVSMPNVLIAPYSAFPLQFDWKKANLKPGTYVFTGEARTSQQTWNFKKEFTITSEQTEKINDQSVFKIIIPKWLKFVEGIMFLLSNIVIILNFRFIKKEKNNV